MEPQSIRRIVGGAGEGHGGKNFSTFVVATSVESPCFSAKCSKQARPDPFHTAHHSTGQRHSWASSRWKAIMWASRAVYTLGSQTILECTLFHQVPDSTTRLSHLAQKEVPLRLPGSAYTNSRFHSIPQDSHPVVERMRNSHQTNGARIRFMHGKRV